MKKKQKNLLIVDNKIDADFILKHKHLAYLNLDWEQIKELEQKDNPNLIRSDSPEMDLVKLIRNPKNFHFTCKYILNVDLMPFQVCILNQLWYHSFPMLIANRGAGKSFLLAIYATLFALIHQGCKVAITGAVFRQSKVIFEYIESIWNNAPILRDIVSANDSGPKHEVDRWSFRLGDSVITAWPVGAAGTNIRGQRARLVLIDEFACIGRNSLVETDLGLIRIGETERFLKNIRVINENGEFEAPEKLIRTPPTDVYRVKTKGGYTFDCSSIHNVKTTEGYKLAKDLTSEDYLVFKNDYKFPESYIKVDGRTIDENLAWILGLLTSEGAVNDKYTISVLMTDRECLDRLELAWKNFDPRIDVKKYRRDGYIDDRGWTCKESYTYSVHSLETREFLEKCGLDKTNVYGKKIPWSILQSPKSVVLAYLSGLFEGDGSCFHWKSHDCVNKLGVAYYTVSEQLSTEVQVLLKKLDIFSCRQTRESKISNKPQWMIRLNGQFAYKFVMLSNIPKWQDKIKSCWEYQNNDILETQGVYYNKNSNRWNVSVLWAGKYKSLKSYKTKEEAKKVYEDFIRENGQCLQIKEVRKLEEKQVLYDFYVPGTNSFNACGFTQHNSLLPEIYENIIAGFTAVSASPADGAKKEAEVEALRQLGFWSEDKELEYLSSKQSNQSIISGTAYYSFNHFAKYYERYKAIIESKGDKSKLEIVFDGEIQPGFDWRDYSIVQLPVELLPPGFMDTKQIARSKATVHSSIYMMEMGATFPKDSNGFFKRTLIESCVCNPPIELESGIVKFRATVKGNRHGRYVFGVDPAFSNDNFSIVVLELHPDHCRVVYCWTMNKEKHKMYLKRKETSEEDFYDFCARKIRTLMKIFPCDLIAMDSQGGAMAVMEALHDRKNLLEGEQPIWMIDCTHPLSDKKPREEDDEAGLHIVELVNFSKADYVSEANHGMRKDMEFKQLLFPYFDPIEISFASEDDRMQNREFDTLEDCVLEIEELKNELATIELTQTSITGREHWDTPDMKSGAKKTKMRKDRYSALLIANMAARRMSRAPISSSYAAIGGFANQIQKKEIGGPLYVGPAWVTNQLNSTTYGASVARNRADD